MSCSTTGKSSSSAAVSIIPALNQLMKMTSFDERNLEFLSSNDDETSKNVISFSSAVSETLQKTTRREFNTNNSSALLKENNNNNNKLIKFKKGKIDLVEDERLKPKTKLVMAAANNGSFRSSIKRKIMNAPKINILTEFEKLGKQICEDEREKQDIKNLLNTRSLLSVSLARIELIKTQSDLLEFDTYLSHEENDFSKDKPMSEVRSMSFLNSRDKKYDLEPNYYSTKINANLKHETLKTESYLHFNVPRCELWWWFHGFQEKIADDSKEMLPKKVHLFETFQKHLTKKRCIQFTPYKLNTVNDHQQDRYFLQSFHQNSKQTQLESIRSWSSALNLVNSNMVGIGLKQNRTRSKKSKRKSSEKYRAVHATRERVRVEVFNGAFDKLRALLPTLPPKKKLAKIEILRLAVCYIAFLDHVLQLK